MSAAGRALSKALDIPENWTMGGRYTIKHIPTEQEFWVGSGAFFFDGWQPYAIRGSIGLVERHWLFFKTRHIRALFRRNPGAEVVRRFSLHQQ